MHYSKCINTVKQCIVNNWYPTWDMKMNEIRNKWNGSPRTIAFQTAFNTRYLLSDFKFSTKKTALHLLRIYLFRVYLYIKVLLIWEVWEIENIAFENSKRVNSLNICCEIKAHCKYTNYLSNFYESLPKALLFKEGLNLQYHCFPTKTFILI